MIEEWRDIPGYGGHYQASSLGRIRTKGRIVRKFSAVAGRVVDQHYKARILSGGPDGEGYLRVHIGIDGRKHNIQIGRLVLLAFVGEPGAGEECCHGKAGPADNSLGNLRWDSHYENNQDRVRAGTYRKGADHHMARLTEEQARAIKYECESPREALERFGVSPSHYHRIKTGESWAHL